MVMLQLPVVGHSTIKLKIFINLEITQIMFIPFGITQATSSSVVHIFEDFLIFPIQQLIAPPGIELQFCPPQMSSHSCPQQTSLFAIPFLQKSKLAKEK